MESDLIKIFTGSDIEANYVAALLKENKIDYIVENRLNQSISAGWVSGSQESSSVIRVSAKDSQKASQLIDEYYKSNVE